MNTISKWCTFFLHDEMFGLRVEDVQEVMMEQPLTPVPLAPEHVVGLLNLRGQIMPAIDLRRRLQFPLRPAGASSKLIVLRSQSGSVSLVVDDIGDVLELPSSRWREPPETLGALHRAFVTAICTIEKNVVLALDVASLVEHETKQAA